MMDGVIRGPLQWLHLPQERSCKNLNSLEQDPYLKALCLTAFMQPGMGVCAYCKIVSTCEVSTQEDWSRASASMLSETGRARERASEREREGERERESEREREKERQRQRQRDRDRK